MAKNKLLATIIVILYAANKQMDLFTRDMVCSTQFDFNKSAFHDDNINEKAFRHKLVQIIKDDNVSR